MRKEVDVKAIAAAFLDSIEKIPISEQPKAIKKFVGFLLANNLLSQAGNLLVAIKEEAMKRKGITAMTFQSAGDLSDADIAKMAGSLAGDLEHIKDNSLLGGLKMKIGDKVVDATVRRMFEQLFKGINN
ncbi:MAG: hypothetical protein A3A80_03640 [Candidatus Terrybacteria bacterium RIFCSPLOWO2_01_FULL_44_24]|uniref:Uncharacterized protein n=1 Tax=Candidatus Terrybacteria bacterium RIFCSPHIGHO2_01_FULL_43_35 TaxID=1802361 RepID=A0A1G2PDM2_9BACT|nr:MAG: hypothetical protein A2828_00560 [Candidatus Terrybacteria bacterium RIFCSPHIGHO2_01_FULL_43_35]OHA49775.1 MAG: hypothetical protein A3B75_02135 [Candidatus Terrybacteria bacterium RIFCSPHIGHO2_02_FULL_43_14]OHA51597.1 MAG: hypothetical protein A3A80_03640 [Candidatus Terrybacteria bacterium RIFCSPLOWO2_01_FULL_44_24]